MYPSSKGSDIPGFCFCFFLKVSRELSTWQGWTLMASHSPWVNTPSPLQTIASPIYSQIHSNYKALKFEVESLPEVNNAILGSPVFNLLNEHDAENIKYFFISHRMTLFSFSVSCLTFGLTWFSVKLCSNYTSISVNLMTYINIL